MNNIRSKISTFINYDNKFYLLKCKITAFIQKRIYSFTYANFGSNSIIMKPIRVIGKKYISIGNNVSILNGARMEVITKWNDMEYNAGINIEDNVSIGQNFHITSCDNLKIGKNTTISGNVFITNIDHEYQDINNHILNQNIKYSKTEIGEECFIGYGAAILAGTILGRHCIVGTNAVVRGIYDDYSVIVGVPARVVKKYNKNNNKWDRVIKQE